MPLRMRKSASVGAIDLRKHYRTDHKRDAFERHWPFYKLLSRKGVSMALPRCHSYQLFPNMNEVKRELRQTREGAPLTEDLFLEVPHKFPDHRPKPSSRIVAGFFDEEAVEGMHEYRRRHCVGGRTISKVESWKSLNSVSVAERRKYTGRHERQMKKLKARKKSKASKSKGGKYSAYLPLHSKKKLKPVRTTKHVKDCPLSRRHPTTLKIKCSCRQKRRKNKRFVQSSIDDFEERLRIYDSEAVDSYNQDSARRSESRRSGRSWSFRAIKTPIKTVRVGLKSRESGSRGQSRNRSRGGSGSIRAKSPERKSPESWGFGLLLPPLEPTRGIGENNGSGPAVPQT